MNSIWIPGAPISRRSARTLGAVSFLVPLLLWSAVSYIPALWHPYVDISDPASVGYFRQGMLVDKDRFADEVAKSVAKGDAPPVGQPANPVYLPAPHEVAQALYTAFATEPRRRSEQWLHESLWHSITIIFWGFVYSCLLGIPLGILCGAYSAMSRLNEPFVEFVRYFPAPAFGALAVAILGIHDAPKVAIIFLGTFFQMVLVLANTTRQFDLRYIEAGMTLGANRIRLLFRVVLPGILPKLYRDLRILLGWAWTYLIVAELIGTSSGITWFITQQARYKNFENVFAAIIVIGLIGLLSDVLLARLGRRLFPWEPTKGERGT